MYIYLGYAGLCGRVFPGVCSYGVKHTHVKHNFANTRQNTVMKTHKNHLFPICRMKQLFFLHFCSVKPNHAMSFSRERV